MQRFLFRRLGPLSSSLTTKITIEHWGFHLFIHNGSETTAIRQSCSGISFHFQLSPLRWQLMHDLALLHSSHSSPFRQRFLFHQGHVSLTTSRNSWTPATITVPPAVMIERDMMWLKHTVACWILQQQSDLLVCAWKLLVTNVKPLLSDGCMHKC